MAAFLKTLYQINFNVLRPRRYIEDQHLCFTATEILKRDFLSSVLF